ncbi:MAG: monofunctional biosynthetic peptidoglycan transglycosylase, partial [Bacteroidota bacterium]
VKRNPIKSLLIFFLVVVIFQILFLPYDNIRQLKTKNAGETAFMREQAANAKEENRELHKMQYWISLRSIPQDAIDAVIVSEDGTFWTHNGFDWFEFRESIERNFEEGRAVRGASTITQQLVKNLYLSSSKNPLRKFKEWILTWYMEQHLGKSRILEIYFNVIEWGDGVYGIEAASRYYFDKSASNLNREECARLAAIIPNPRKHRADVDSKYVLRRSKLILERMEARGM